jgi:hypothetical protein
MTTNPPIPPAALQVCKELHLPGEPDIGTTRVWIIASSKIWIVFAQSERAPQNILARASSIGRWTTHDLAHARKLWRDWITHEGCALVHVGLWNRWGVQEMRNQR